MSPDGTVLIMDFIDEAILEACLEKNSRAQFRLYKLCYSFLMGICVRYNKNREDAEEVLNMGFLKMLNNISKYKKEVPFTLWMRRIMINTIIDEYRKNKKGKELFQPIDFNEYHEEFDDAVVNDYVKKMDTEQLQLLIDKLPTMSRSVFNLFVIDGYKHEEIGKMLGMSTGTSKWHLNLARTRLKEMISKMQSYYKIAAS